MDTYYLPTEQDRRLLNDLIARVFGIPQRPGAEPPDPPPPQAPEVYVAKTGPNGIAAITTEDLTGTGTGTGTAGEPSYDDLPVYKVVRDRNPVRFQLKRNHPTHCRVFNVGTSAVPGDTWVLVVRDKWGSWHVAQGGGGSKRAAVLTGKRYVQGADGQIWFAYSGEFGRYIGNPPRFVGSGEFFGIPNLNVYTGTQADIDTGSGTGTTVTGEPFLETDPAYHVNNIGVPVPWYTEVWRGDGCWLFGAEEPRWEFVLQTDEIDPVTAEAPGQLLDWDQNTKTSKAIRTITLVWFPPPPTP